MMFRNLNFNFSSASYLRHVHVLVSFIHCGWLEHCNYSISSSDVYQSRGSFSTCIKCCALKSTLAVFLTYTDVHCVDETYKVEDKKTSAQK